MTWERSAWTGAASLAPRDVLRHALGAPDRAARAAAAATAAASLVEEGRVDEAIKLLEAELARDVSEPVDNAWLTLQHARTCAEVGMLDQARTAAISAQRVLVTNPNDVTATAIAGAAAELLFNTSAWGQRDVKDVITGADTAAVLVARATMSEALTALADRTYKAWARDTTVVEFFGGADMVNNQLLAASLTANYVGDHADWRHQSALLGRDKLLRLGGDTYRRPADVDPREAGTRGRLAWLVRVDDRHVDP